MSDYIKLVIGILALLSPIYLFVGGSVLVDYIEKKIEEKKEDK